MIRAREGLCERSWKWKGRSSQKVPVCLLHNSSLNLPLGLLHFPPCGPCMCLHSDVGCSYQCFSASPTRWSKCFSSAKIAVEIVRRARGIFWQCLSDWGGGEGCSRSSTAPLSHPATLSPHQRCPGIFRIIFTALFHIPSCHNRIFPGDPRPPVEFIRANVSRHKTTWGQNRPH